MLLVSPATFPICAQPSCVPLRGSAILPRLHFSLPKLVDSGLPPSPLIWKSLWGFFEKGYWPACLPDYITKCMASQNQIPEVSLASTIGRMILLVRWVKDHGNLEHVNWPEVPLPQQMIQAQRLQGFCTKNIVMTVI